MLSCGLQISLPQGLLSTSPGEAAASLHEAPAAPICSLGLPGNRTAPAMSSQGPLGLPEPQELRAPLGWAELGRHPRKGRAQQCPRLQEGTRGWAQGKSSSQVKYSIMAGSAISALPHCHSLTMEVSPHELQPQQEPGLNLHMSVCPKSF